MNAAQTPNQESSIQPRLDALLHLFQPTSFLFVLTPDGIYESCYSCPDEARLTVPQSEHKGKRIEDVVPEPLRESARFYFDLAVKCKKPQMYAYPHHNGGWMARHIVPVLEDDVVLSVVMEVFDIAVTPIPKRYVKR